MSTEAAPLSNLLAARIDELDISVREAARLVGTLSETRLRQILAGSSAPPRTAAKVADALGVTVEQLEDAGLSEVADSLRKRQRNIAAHPNAHRVGMLEIAEWVNNPGSSLPPNELLAIYSTEDLVDELRRRDEDVGTVTRIVGSEDDDDESSAAASVERGEVAPEAAES